MDSLIAWAKFLSSVAIFDPDPDSYEECLRLSLLPHTHNERFLRKLSICDKLPRTSAKLLRSDKIFARKKYEHEKRRIEREQWLKEADSATIPPPSVWSILEEGLNFSCWWMNEHPSISSLKRTLVIDAPDCYETTLCRENAPRYVLRSGDSETKVWTTYLTIPNELGRAVDFENPIEFYGSGKSALAFLHSHMSNGSRIKHIVLHYRFTDQFVDFGGGQRTILLPATNIDYFRRLMNSFVHRVYGLSSIHVPDEPSPSATLVIDSEFWEKSLWRKGAEFVFGTIDLGLEINYANPLKPFVNSLQHFARLSVRRCKLMVVIRGADTLEKRRFVAKLNKKVYFEARGRPAMGETRECLCEDPLGGVRLNECCLWVLPLEERVTHPERKKKKRGRYRDRCRISRFPLTRYDLYGSESESSASS